MSWKEVYHQGWTLASAEKATILRCEVGSKAYGTSVDESQSDRDEMGVLLEPLRIILTKDNPKPFVYRDAVEREGTHNAKSKAGDLDLKLYGLKHFCHLALNGNPDVLMLLFTKPLVADARGMRLQELRQSFLSQQCIPKFKGYMQGQRLRLQGLLGQKDVNRPELVEKYGYDTKYAMQMIRLGLQAVEIISTGQITLPMASAQLCKDIRVGAYTQPQVVEFGRELEDLIDKFAKTTPLPEKPNSDKVWDFAGSLYLELWKCHAFDNEVQRGVLMSSEQRAKAWSDGNKKEQREGEGL